MKKKIILKKKLLIICVSKKRYGYNAKLSTKSQIFQQNKNIPTELLALWIISYTLHITLRRKKFN